MNRIDHLLKAENIAKRLKLEKPSTMEDLLIKCKLPLKYVGEGAFRFVFKVVGTALVIKVPMQEQEQAELGSYYDHTPLIHSTIEWNYRKRVMRLKKYEFFRKYMPAYHYIVPSTGVILMDYYRPVSYYRTAFDDEIETLQAKLRYIGVTDGDIGVDKKDNYGIDRDGNLRILDLGCFGGELE